MSDINPLQILQSLQSAGSASQTPSMPQFGPQNMANPAAMRAVPNPGLQIGNVGFQGAQPAGQMGVQDAQEQDQYQALKSQQATQAEQQRIQIQEALRNADLSETQRATLKRYSTHMLDLVGIAGDTAKDQMFTQMSKNAVSRHADHMEEVAMANAAAQQLEDTFQKAEDPKGSHRGIPLGLGKQSRELYKKMTGQDAPENDEEFRNLIQFGKGQAESAAGNPATLRQEAQAFRLAHESHVEPAKISAAASTTNTGTVVGGENLRQTEKLAGEPTDVQQRLMTQFNKTGGEGMNSRELAELASAYPAQALASAEKNKTVGWLKVDAAKTQAEKDKARQDVVDNALFGNKKYQSILNAYEAAVEREKTKPAAAKSTATLPSKQPADPKANAAPPQPGATRHYDPVQGWGWNVPTK